MSINRILQLTLVFLILIAISSLAWADESHDAIYYTSSVVLYLVVLIAILELKKSKITPLITYLVFISILWVAIRITYLCFRYESINYDYLVSFDQSDVAWSVFMTTLSTIAIVFGLIVGGMLRQRMPSINMPLLRSNIRINYFAGFFILIMLLSVIKVFVGNESKLWAIFSIFTSFDVFVILLVTLLVRYHGTLDNRRVILLYAMCVLYVVVRILMGSKAGMFELAVVGVAAVLCVKEMPRIPKNIIVFSLLLAPVAVALFFVGHVARLSKSFAGDEYSFYYLVSNYVDNYERVLGYLEPIEFADFIFRRLSMFDYLNVFFNADPSAHYLGIAYGLKMMWNSIWPAFIPLNLEFQDAAVFPANLFKVAYGYGTYNEVIDNYHSDMLPLFGYLFINFGPFSLLMLFLLGVFAALGYRAILNSKLKAAYFFQVLYLIIFLDFVFGMGFSSTFQNIIFFYLPPLMFYLLLQNIRVWKSVPSSVLHAKT